MVDHFYQIHLDQIHLDPKDGYDLKTLVILGLEDPMSLEIRTFLKRLQVVIDEGPEAIDQFFTYEFLVAT